MSTELSTRISQLSVNDSNGQNGFSHDSGLRKPSPAPVQSQSISSAQPTKESFYQQKNSPANSASFNHQNSVPPSHPWPTELSGPGFGGGFATNNATSDFHSNALAQAQLPSPPASTFSRSSGGQPSHPRGAVPHEWMSEFAPPNAYGALLDNRGLGQQQRPGRQAAYAGPILPQDSDEVIATAIVIKSIPFSCPREHLLGLMDSLGLAAPFALNYHNENGQFRGLAFANYTTEEQAAMTVHALQGFELQGRKLRVEFKRVLKEGEKERIERDKAVRRMRSLGLDMRQQPKQDWNRRPQPPPMPNQYQQYASQPPYGGGYRAEEEDYGRVMPGQFSSAFNQAQQPPRNGPPNFYHQQPPQPQFAQFNAQVDPPFSSFGSPPSDPGTSISARIVRSPTDSSSDIPSLATVDVDSSSVGTANDLNLNEAESLEIYSRVLIFKDDSLRDELSFARSLDQDQRRKVHLVAQKLALESKTVGEGAERHVVVYKGTARSAAPPPSHKTLRHSASTLGRHTQAHAFLSPESSLAPGSLRAKQSMPDFRRRSSQNLRGDSHSLQPSSSYDSAGRGIFASGFFDPPAERNEEEEHKWRNSPSIADSRSGSSLSLQQLGEENESGLNGQSSNGVQRQPRGPSEGEGGWWGKP